MGLSNFVDLAEFPVSDEYIGGFFEVIDRRMYLNKKYVGDTECAPGAEVVGTFDNHFQPIVPHVVQGYDVEDDKFFAIFFSPDSSYARFINIPGRKDRFLFNPA